MLQKHSISNNQVQLLATTMVFSGPDQLHKDCACTVHSV